MFIPQMGIDGEWSDNDDDGVRENNLINIMIWD